ncbi:MAG: serine/threonine protein kinase, partial [Oscillospiraceae bacterium]|nr:serine/threonine protein kinase [Oscillospiraceae bacterium]
MEDTFIFSAEEKGGKGKKQCLCCMEFYGAEYDVCPFCGSEEEEMYSLSRVLYLTPGTKLQERYVVGRALGAGGFGVTYIGWDTHLVRKVAIKEYLPSEFATRMYKSDELVVAGGEHETNSFTAGKRKFLEEGRKLAQVSNVDGIVHMYDCFEANGTAYIAMEYLEGETLETYLEREGKMSEQQVLDIMLPLLHALEAVHTKGIIHRDIAPDNIFLVKDAKGDTKAKIIDFGASKFASTSHSKSLSVMIKSGYSAEEQYRSNGNQGAFTDVYGLAA